MEKILFAPPAIEDKVLDLAEMLNNLYPDEPKALYPVLSPILQGGITFFHDVAKHLLFDAYVDCVGIKSYEGKKQSAFDLYKAWNINLMDKDVWLIDDICDSGNTMAYLEKLAYDKGAKHVYKATLLKRHDCPMELDFCGYTLQDEWVFGYGMDHPDGLGRLSDSIFQV
jgi:hypoxanthine phosphoribosyltransferase